MKKIIIISLLAIILIVSWYFLIYKPAQVTIVTSNEGSPCTTGGVPGKIKNGVCVPLGVGSGTVSFN